MTDAQPTTPATASDSKLIRIAIWVAIGALIAAAIVCVIWVLLGEQNGLIGRAFLTILLLAAFAGVALLDAHLAPRRPAWFALTSMIVWVVTLLLGAFLIWMPQRDFYYGVGVGRFASFLLIILILQLAVLHVRLFIKAHQRFVTTFTKIVTFTTLGLVALLALLLVFPLTFGEYIDFRDAYWRVVVAIAILAAVGTALVPLVNALFAPKKPRAAVPFAAPVPIAPPAQQQAGPAPQQAGLALLPWPTFADGATPLPMLPDGSPDWNAYYTGYPTPGAQIFAPPPSQAPQPPAQGYEGFPPPPPLPPRS